MSTNIVTIEISSSASELAALVQQALDEGEHAGAAASIRLGDVRITSPTELGRLFSKAEAEQFAGLMIAQAVARLRTRAEVAEAQRVRLRHALSEEPEETPLAVAEGVAKAKLLRTALRPATTLAARFLPDRQTRHGSDLAALVLEFGHRLERAQAQAVVGVERSQLSPRHETATDRGTIVLGDRRLPYRVENGRLVVDDTARSELAAQLRKAAALDKLVEMGASLDLSPYTGDWSCGTAGQQPGRCAYATSDAPIFAIEAAHAKWAARGKAPFCVYTDDERQAIDAWRLGGPHPWGMDQ